MMNDTPPVARYRPYNKVVVAAGGLIMPRKNIGIAKKNIILHLMKLFYFATHSRGTSGFNVENKLIDTCNTFKLKYSYTHVYDGVKLGINILSLFYFILLNNVV
jgi:hypothetical protein